MNQERYSRQIQVRQFGATGQERLHQSRVVLIGAGGLGCVVAPLLAGAGVGHITLVDHDDVALSNLHRQTVYHEAHVGQPKAKYLAAHISALNSGVVVSAHVGRCHVDNVNELIDQADVVIDAADNFAVSYLLSDACAQHQKLLVAASVNKTYGNVGVFCGPSQYKLPSFRSVFSRLPDTPVSCDVVGVTGPSVAAIGAVQAQEVLKCLLGNTPKPELWQFELWDYAVHSIDVSESSNSQHEPIAFVSPAQISNEWVIDVREKEEVQVAPLPFADVLNYPLSSLQSTTVIDRNKPWVFACKSGQRALIAAQRLSPIGHPCKVLFPGDE